MKKAFFWFRRDLRIEDNRGLFEALNSGYSILPVFIFDPSILARLPDRSDRRVHFIHQTLLKLKNDFQKRGSDLIVEYGQPLEVYQRLFKTHKAEGLFFNRDHDPYPIRRDKEITDFCLDLGFFVQSYQDHFIFERDQILKDNRGPYTVFTPYSKKWRQSLANSIETARAWPSENHLHRLFQIQKSTKVPTLMELGMNPIHIQFDEPLKDFNRLKNYGKTRNEVSNELATSQLGVHLRFGTISPRKVLRETLGQSEEFVTELIWRDFFSQVLFHFPSVVHNSFRTVFDQIDWNDSEQDFQRWVDGQTGYPLVDAGMRQLKATGTMPNRVRMNVASFLCKDLLIHWKKGERYFAGLLLDYDLSANNGNWQWAAGTGCDAAPYFRVFNPEIQRIKFDPKSDYIKKWVPEWGSSQYVSPMVDHSQASRRAIAAFSAVARSVK